MTTYTLEVKNGHIAGLTGEQVRTKLAGLANLGVVLIDVRQDPPDPDPPKLPPNEPDIEHTLHPCETCGSAFPTGMALGGHVSSAHRRPRRILGGRRISR